MKKASKNPFITKLHGSFQTENHLFIVMEYVSGGNLYELMSKEAPLPDDKLRTIIAELLCGLQHPQRIHEDSNDKTLGMSGFPVLRV
ncbi:probable serine/threonine-protein kinase DDB_G0277449 [Pyxicephalus adspersus]|uniref:probable serine/threonine-protein kinase DDB_G0277449 n=1 Tax=Pyxicephalus adspersus TaxID=30357 RepID=UPI003B5A0A2E